MSAFAAVPDRALRGMLGRPVVVDRRELYVEAQLALRLLEIADSPPLESLSVADARAQAIHDAQAFAGRRVKLARVEDVSVSGAAGPLGARLYVPDANGQRGGLLVYFHGDGFVVGDLDTHDNACRCLAQRAGAAVLSVDYRRAPERHFPAAVEDARAAFGFAVEHASELGGDPARVAVGGDSAGGNLAAGVTRLAAGDRGPAPVFQLLFYPWLDLSRKRESYRLFGEGFYLTEAELDRYKHHYVTEEADALDPRCSPLLADDLRGVAPAYVAIAGFDPLRDEGEEYADCLRAAGVAVALRRHDDLIHALVNTIGIGRVGREALLEAAGALRVGLALARRG
jgi:acetyl esterase/lipase